MVGWENLDVYDKNQEDQSFPRKTRVYTSQCLQIMGKILVSNKVVRKCYQIFAKHSFTLKNETFWRQFSNTVCQVVKA